VSLSEVEVIRVVALAERLGIPAAAVLRRAIAAYVKKFRSTANLIEDAMTSSIHPSRGHGAGHE
jgi:hypothetical protein